MMKITFKDSTSHARAIADSTVQRFNNSTVQRFNGSTSHESTNQRINESTIQRFNASTLQRSLAPTLHRRATRAFTLVELLLVLVILGILAAIVIPKFSGRTEQAKEKAAVTQIANLSTAINNYEVDNSGYPKSLNDLLVQPRDAQNWHGPYLQGDTV